MKNFLFLIAISCFICGCEATKKLKESRVLLKQFAYCACVEYASDDSAFFKNDISTGVLAELTDHSRSALDSVDKMAKSYASTIKPSILADHENKKAVLFNCFVFYESKQLDSLIKTLDKKFTYVKGW